jgi:hypothetical protein
MDSYKSDRCPCCQSKKLAGFKDVQQFHYLRCLGCGTIFIDPDYLNQIDNGQNVRKYDDDYWGWQIHPCREHSYGITLARMAEAFYYSRIPINKFLDIGAGAGYFLDAVASLLPNHKDVFWAIEKFPPPQECRTKSPNYIVGELRDLAFKVDGGICTEVAEHLTPRMLSNLFKDMGHISSPGALYEFTTGLPEAVLYDYAFRDYMDPFRDGHIVSYSIKAIELLANPHGFSVFPLKGKTWAFVVEYQSKWSKFEDFQSRIFLPLDHNLSILDDKDMGSVLKILGLETARAYSSYSWPRLLKAMLPILLRRLK